MVFELRSDNASKILALGGSEVLNRGAIFAFSVLAARVLPNEEFGTLGFAITVAGFLWLVSDGGQTTVGLRDIAQGRRGAREVLGEVTGTRLAIATAVLFVTATGFVTEIPDWEVVWFAAFFILSQAIFPAWLYRAKSDYLGYFGAYLKVGILFFALIALVTIFRSHVGEATQFAVLRSFFWLMAAVWALRSALLSLGIRGIGELKLRPSLRAWLGSAPLSSAGIIAGFFPLMAFFSVRSGGSATDLGNLSAIWQIQQLLLAAAAMLHLLFHPQVYSAASYGQPSLIVVFKDQFKASMAFVVVAALILVVGGEQLLGLVFGQAYEAPDMARLWLSLAISGVVMRYLAEPYLVAAGKFACFPIGAFVAGLAGMLLIGIGGRSIELSIAAYAVAEVGYGAWVVGVARKHSTNLVLASLVFPLVPLIVGLWSFS